MTTSPTSKKAVAGYIMAGIGFAFILYTAMNFIFGWKLGATSGALGVIFTAAGMAMVRKSKREKVE